MNEMEKEVEIEEEESSESIAASENGEDSSTTDEMDRLKRRRQFIRMVHGTISALVTVAAVSVLITSLWLPVVRISGTSMTPTLNEGDLIVCTSGGSYQQGDIIAFYYGNKLLVKRCIAAPGQWVTIDDEGNVYVDNTLIDEPYVQDRALGETDLEYPFQVPEGKYFVLGDHRAVSMDSRLSQVGCVAKEQVAGKIGLCLWPPADIGIVNN